MEHIFFWIIVGIVAGALAKQVVPGEGPGGVLGDLVIGVLGAIAGGWLFQLVMGASMGGWIGSTLVAFVGACILLFVLRAVTRRPTA